MLEGGWEPGIYPRCRYISEAGQLRVAMSGAAIPDRKSMNPKTVTDSGFGISQN